MRGKTWIQGLCLATVTVIMSACSGGGSDCPGGDKVSHLGVDYCEVTSPYTGKVWLDRNLGASQVCTAYNDTTCYGDYYQWGRNADGHEDSGSDTNDTLATQIDPVQATVEGKFIINSNNPYDWANIDSTGSQRAANWSKTDGSSVCPQGFRVPTIAELRVETLDATDVAGSTKVTNRATAFTNFLKLPSAGTRDSNSASMGSMGEWGLVWAGSASNSFSYFVSFGSDNAGWGSGARASGLSVRCLKEDH